MGCKRQHMCGCYWAVVPGGRPPISGTSPATVSYSGIISCHMTLFLLPSCQSPCTQAALRPGTQSRKFSSWPRSSAMLLRPYFNVCGFSPVGEHHTRLLWRSWWVNFVCWCNVKVPNLCSFAGEGCTFAHPYLVILPITSVHECSLPSPAFH